MGPTILCVCVLSIYVYGSITQVCVHWQSLSYYIIALNHYKFVCLCFCLESTLCVVCTYVCMCACVYVYFSGILVCLKLFSFILSFFLSFFHYYLEAAISPRWWCLSLSTTLCMWWKRFLSFYGERRRNREREMQPRTQYGSHSWRLNSFSYSYYSSTFKLCCCRLHTRSVALCTLRSFILLLSSLV